MNPRRCYLLLIAAASMLVTGCLHTSSKERDASFAPYVDEKIENESTETFILLRSALLISGNQLIMAESVDTPGRFDLKAPKLSFSFGSAAAIDRRGYFLTAAHCTNGDSLFLAFSRNGQSHVEPASIVWRGDVTKEEPDLALLYAPGAVNEVFEWAFDFKRGDRVIAAGPNYDRSDSFNLVCIGGSILERSESTEFSFRLMSISHTAPGHVGDSGGPLATVGGRLVGINVRGGLRFSLSNPFGRRLTYAIRPDLAWLSRLLDEHAHSTQ